LDKQSHPLLSTGSDNVDVEMQMLWDWNHVITLNLTDSEETPVVSLIPTTGSADMIMVHRECRKCWSLNAVKWAAETNDLPIGGANMTFTNKTFDYFYMMHVYRV